MEKMKEVTKDVKVKNKKKVEKSDKKHKKGLIIILIIVIILILLVALSTFIAKLVFDYITYNNLSKLRDTEVYEITSYFPKVFLSKKNVELIKEKNILFSVNYKGENVVFMSEDVKTKNVVKICREKRNFDEIESLATYDTLYVGNTNFAEIYMKLPKYLSKYDTFDVYTLNPDMTCTLVISKLSKDELGNIRITYNDKDALGYIITHIETKDIIINDLVEGVIGIGKGEEKSLSVEIKPDNATIKDVKIVSENEEIVKVSENNSLMGVNVGDATVSICVENVVKEVNVHVSNPVKAIVLNTGGLNLYVGSSFEITYSVQPEDAENKEVVFEIDNTEVAVVEGTVVKALKVGSANLTVKSAVYEISQVVPINVVEAIKPGTVATNLTYVNGILIANKTYSLPRDYNPGGLTAETMAAFNNMKAAAAKEGLNFWISSGFRSYNTQYNLYNNYVASYGQAAADTFSARAGHSEHQTGLAMDVNYIEDWFGDTKEGKWLADNAHKYGFIIRYPKSKEAITGYKYEPWHIRYLGVDIATDVYNSGLCLEEYLNITSKYNE